MKRLTLAVLSAVGLMATAFSQTVPLYENFGSVTDNPQIDAIAFANYGFFSAVSVLPYDFQNTLYFTNRGAMTATPGFRFATASSGQPPFRRATNFFNDVGAVINTGGFISGSGSGTVNSSGTTNVGTFTGQIIGPSYILVSADTIVNKGLLVAGAAGLVQLNGNNVDLTRSGVGIGRLELSSTHSETQTNFFPDPGIYDNYWELTNGVMGVGSLLTISKTSTNATAPAHTATNGPFAPFPSLVVPAVSVKITNTNSTSSVYTNVGGLDPATGKPTNIIRQAAFVGVGDTNFAATVKWVPSTILGNPFQTAIVELKMADTNVMTGDLEPSTLYLQDFMASDTNYAVIPNTAAFPTTYRPAPFILSRTPPLSWTSAAGAKGTLTNTFFFDPKDTNFVAIVTNLYAAYGAQIDSLSSPIPSAPGSDVTEAPGRIEINATNLNLTRARLRSTGLLSIHTPNLVGSTNVLFDAENVAYDLSVPTGSLKIQNMAKDRVVRLNGSLRVWSAIFTNFFGTAITNQVDDGSGNLTNEVTNAVTEIDYHMLIVDATGLVTTKPVFTHDFVTHASDVVLSDPMTVVGSILIGADTFTLNSSLTLTGSIEAWGSTNAPRLKSLTIGKGGKLFVPNIANLGQDTPGGYNTMTNNGLISGSGILIRSASYVSSGTLTSIFDGITIEAQSAQFQNAANLSINDLNISATDLRFTTSTNFAQGTLRLNATHSLSDSGPGASNVFSAQTGIELPSKPALGDLLGSTIRSIAVRYGSIDHIWAGEDRGASAAGFQDNVAIGHLVLGGDTDFLLTFRGATGANGMYVDLLELTGPLTNALAAGNLGAFLSVDPSLTIYFANSNVAADQLEQQSGGRLVHVDYSGPADVTQDPSQPGNTAQGSQNGGTGGGTGSDGTTTGGGPGSSDPASGLRLVGTRANDQTSIALTWLAQPSVAYRIEYTSSLETPDWQALSTFTNSSSQPQTATVQDRMPGDHAQRYYRVRSNP